MLVDPQIQALLDKGTGVSATHTLPVDVARTQYEVRIALMAPPADIGSFREQTIEGPGWRAEHPHLFRRAAAGMDPVGALP
jgi:acetyl esterase